MDNAKFFNDNVDFYGAKQIYDYDNYLLDYLKRNKETNFKLLDIGGGNGLFCCLLKSQFPNSDISILDPSTHLLDLIPDKTIKTIVGELPNNLATRDIFDYIHIKEVLHHVTSYSPGSSKELVKTSLRNIRGLLKDNGRLMIHELYYEGHIFPTCTRNIIFSALTVQNKLGIRIPQKAFIPGLSVCFYTRDELFHIIAESGYKITEVKEYPWATPPNLSLEMIRNKSMLLKSWGRIVVICRKE